MAPEEEPAGSHEQPSDTRPRSLEIMMAGPGQDNPDVSGGDDEKGQPLQPSTTGTTVPFEHDYPEGGYGWVVVASVAFINGHTWGLNSAYAVFLAYYLNSGTFAGTSSIAFAFVGGLSFSIALLVSPVVTVCVRRFGTTPTALVGVVLEAVAFIGASFTTKIWHLLLSQGVCFGLGSGFLFVSSVPLIPQWFSKRRSFAVAIGTAGSGVGGLIYSLAAQAMLQSIGLPWAYRTLAIITFVVNVVCAILMRDRNKILGSVHVAFRLELFKRVEFWLLLSWLFFSMMGYVIVVFSLPDSGQAVGLSPSRASLMAAMFNLSQGVGRPALGLASDYVGRMNVAGLSTLVAMLASYFLWIFAGQTFGGLLVYSLFGAVVGSVWPTVSPVTAEVVGIQLLPSALSILWLLLAIPGLFSEVIAVAIKQPGKKNGYLPVQLLTGSVFFISFVSCWLLRAWKMHQVETKQRLHASRHWQQGQAVPLEPESFSTYLMRGKWVFARQWV